MIPTIAQREVITGGEGEVSSFGIDVESQAHIMSILRDRLYTDKILAILREYSANAWDANREAGKAHKPIYVHVPTDTDPTLIIRDFGFGLSPEGMRKVYTQYGKSTKRGTNNAVGMLGIGSKSGFAYASNFTITSWHGGKKYIYNAVLDATNKGVLQLLHEEPSTEESGIEIQIAAKRSDVYSFQSTAQDLFRFFEPRPDINVELPAPLKNDEQLKNGIIDTDGNRWIAVMGCVPYHVNLSQLRDVAGFDCDNYDRFGGVFYFNIGDVDVSASREELEYNDRTKKALVEKFNALVDEYVLHTIKKIEDGKGTPWQKRLEAQSLNKLGLAPEGDMFVKWVKITDDIIKEFALDFKVWRGSELAHTLTINERVRIVVQDDFKRRLAGYELQEYDYLVKPSLATGFDRKSLDEFITLLNIEGVPVIKLTDITWYPKNRNGWGPREINPKHRVRTFKLRGENTFFSKPYSDNWDAESEREATKDDIYVVLYNFKCEAYHFYTLYSRDRTLAKTFGFTMPEVYGYKRTEKRPAQPIGVEYSEWSKKFRESLLTPTNLRLLELRERAAPVNFSWYEGYSYQNLSQTHVNKLADELGADHIIVQFMTAAFEAKKELDALKIDSQAFDTLIEIANASKNDIVEKTRKQIKGEADVLYQIYPLLKSRHANLTNLVTGDEKKLWIDYVKLVDKVK